MIEDIIKEKFNTKEVSRYDHIHVNIVHIDKSTNEVLSSDAFVRTDVSEFKRIIIESIIADSPDMDQQRFMSTSGFSYEEKLGRIPLDTRENRPYIIEQSNIDPIGATNNPSQKCFILTGFFDDEGYQKASREKAESDQVAFYDCVDVICEHYGIKNSLFMFLTRIDKLTSKTKKDLIKSLNTVEKYIQETQNGES